MIYVVLDCPYMCAMGITNDPNLSPARAALLVRWAVRIEQFARDSGRTYEEICVLLKSADLGVNPRGGGRSGAGRKPRDWRAVTGGKDDAGEFAGRDLYDLQPALLTEAALYPGVCSLQEAFGHLMLRLEAIRPLGKKRPTWVAYQHALKNPPKGLREAAGKRIRARRVRARLRLGIHPCTDRRRCLPG